MYCKPPFAGPEHVLAYLGRYTHRVAISNDRLVAVADDRVRFRWRDYADGDRVKIMELGIDEFLRRFLLHVVPNGFVRIRHFGLLANRRRAAALAQCRALLAQPPPPAPRAPGVGSDPHAARDRARHRPLSGLPARPAPPARPAAPGSRGLGYLVIPPGPLPEVAVRAARRVRRCPRLRGQSCVGRPARPTRWGAPARATLTAPLGGWHWSPSGPAASGSPF